MKAGTALALAASQPRASEVRSVFRVTTIATRILHQGGALSKPPIFSVLCTILGGSAAQRAIETADFAYWNCRSPSESSAVEISVSADLRIAFPKGGLESALLGL